MAQAAQTVFQQGGDPQAEFARIRQENQDLQREREWLIEDNFEEGFWKMLRFARSVAAAVTWGLRCVSASGSCAVRSRRRS